ncbi:hypothetical protein JOM56_013463 [Amanita muscaria]
MRALVCFDPAETAMKIRSITDAENLVELIFCLNKNQCFKSWFGVAADNATRLALALYGRVPVLPRSLFLNLADLDMGERTYQGKACKIWGDTNFVRRHGFSSFTCGNQSHANIAPFLGICPHLVSQTRKDDMLREWRLHTNPSVSTIQRIVFEVAKACRYVHSLGIIFCYDYFTVIPHLHLHPCQTKLI